MVQELTSKSVLDDSFIGSGDDEQTPHPYAAAASESTTTTTSTDPTLALLALAGGLVTIGLFAKSHMDGEKRREALQRIQPLSHYTTQDGQAPSPVSTSNGSHKNAAKVRLALINPLRQDVVDAAQQAFLCFSDDVVVEPRTVALYAGCDADRSTVDAMSTLARQEVLEAYASLNTPCMSYHRSVSVDGAEAELLMDAQELLQRRGGRMKLCVEHVLAWTLDGTVAESMVTGAYDGDTAKPTTENVGTVNDLADAFVAPPEAAEQLLGKAGAATLLGAADNDRCAIVRGAVGPSAAFVEAALRLQHRKQFHSKSWHSAVGQQSSHRGAGGWMNGGFRRALQTIKDGVGQLWNGGLLGRGNVPNPSADTERPNPWTLRVDDGRSTSPPVEDIQFPSFAAAAVALLQAVRLHCACHPAARIVLFETNHVGGATPPLYTWGPAAE